MSDSIDLSQARLKPREDVPDDARLWDSAIDDFYTRHMPPGKARLFRISESIQTNLVLCDADSRFLAAALARIANGDDPKNALGIGGRQHQGREKRSERETYVRWLVAYRVIARMRSIAGEEKRVTGLKERALDEIASELVRGAAIGPRQPGRGDLPDAAHERARSFAEGCYREFGESERDFIRAEIGSDEFPHSLGA